MACFSPVTITVKEPNFTGGLRRLQVPCGKCFSCLKRYQYDWSLRISSEFRHYGSGIFFTLTYSNDHVPTRIHLDTGEFFFSVCKRHVQNLLKRLRTSYFRMYGVKADIKYFITSEYGPRTFRPHYHGIIFGISLQDFTLLALRDWRRRYGFFSARVVSGNNCLKSARYVAKYCSKGCFECPYVSKGLVDKTFHLVSKGLGMSYVNSMRDFHLCKDLPHNLFSRLNYHKFVGDRCFVLMDNFKYSMPKYYKIKIYGQKTYLSRKVADYLRQKYELLLDEKLRQLQSSRHCSLGEAYYIHNMQDDSQRLYANQNAREALARYYSKSML